MLSPRLSTLLAGLCLAAAASPQAAPANTAWPAYGANAAGQRYSPASQLTPANVPDLHIAWHYHTRALETKNPHRTEAAFEATPILLDRTLFFTTPFDQVIALDAVTGSEKWRYDPAIPNDFLAGVYTSRGVASWRSGGPEQPCAQRIFVATLDGRLIALDAASGNPCAAFGTSGTVDLKKNLPTQTSEPYEEYGVTSPPDRRR